MNKQTDFEKQVIQAGVNAGWKDLGDGWFGDPTAPQVEFHWMQCNKCGFRIQGSGQSECIECHEGLLLRTN